MLPSAVLVVVILTPSTWSIFAMRSKINIVKV